MIRAHSASVPISVHLDHATDADQLELAVGLAEKGIAFDSIMVDASHADVRLPFHVCHSVADM
jgi:fructose-bisphosphate aldolase class II